MSGVSVAIAVERSNVYITPLAGAMLAGAGTTSLNGTGPGWRGAPGSAAVAVPDPPTETIPAAVASAARPASHRPVVTALTLLGPFSLRGGDRAGGHVPAGDADGRRGAVQVRGAVGGGQRGGFAGPQ